MICLIIVMIVEGYFRPNIQTDRISAVWRIILDRLFLQKFDVVFEKRKA